MKKLIISLAAFCLGTGAAIAATPPTSGLEGRGRVISDGELADQRGKFVTSDSVRFFGIQMQTRWVDQNGLVTAATLLFTVNFATETGDIGAAVPILMAGYVRDNEQGTGLVPGSATSVAAGDFATGSGALQTLQIAGSNNNVQNDMHVAILPAGDLAPVGTDGLSPIGASQDVLFGDGDQIQFMVSPGELGMMLTGGGDDRSLQSFGGADGRATQQAYIGSDGNNLHNDMNVIVGVEPSATPGSISIQNSLMSLQGL